jgi:hypothetical protein
MAKPTATTLTRNLRILPTAGVNTRAGLFGEIGYDRTTSTLVVYDGLTPGGFPLLRADLNNLEGSIIDVTGSVFGDDSVLLVDGVRSKIVGPVETTTVLASSGITGNLTGNVTGNVLGNVTGNVSGNAGTITSQANSATITASSTNTANQIVLRDSSGNFSAGTITANISGNVTGNVTGNVSGNAGTVTNGIYTNQTYTDPSWLTINLSKITFTTGPSITYQGTGTNLGVRSTTTNLDFGSAPISSKTFTVADVNATTTSKIAVYAHPTTDNGALGGDEFEMDPIHISAVCLTNGSITFYANAGQGPVKGSRNFHYVVI